MHVEYFPSHRLSGLNLALDELIAAFIHAQGDQLTSLGSTFPYTAKQCKDFLRILCQARDIPPTPQTTCMVARIWGAIGEHLISLLPIAPRLIIVSSPHCTTQFEAGTRSTTVKNMHGWIGTSTSSMTKRVKAFFSQLRPASCWAFLPTLRSSSSAPGLTTSFTCTSGTTS